MRISIQKYLLLLVFSVVALGAWAVVSEYAFTSTLGTYNEISGGTVLGTVANDQESFNAIPLGFTFTYNGVAYTEVSVQTNGFIALGSTVAASNVAISSATGTNNIAAVLNRDLKSRDNGELSYLLTGTAPTRIFTIQWKNYRRVPTTTANDVLNFQIQLQEQGNKVVFVYGSFTAVTAATAAAIQVGLRGDSNADFNNRTTTTDWSATAAGTANNNSCTLSATVFPASGLTFTFAPATAGDPPMPAQTPMPANAATNVATNANLSWITGGGVTDGYKVFLGTNNPPTNIVNGTIQTATTYDPADFAYSTTYYWQIVPFNQYGDALNCPVWSFTTLADPTITTYPYAQNFDGVTPPALPLGWMTVNANADAYTWETYTGNAHSGTNSIRVRYNTTIPMNDWLIMPPLQFTQDYIYRLKFNYRAASATYPEKLAVYWGTAPTAAAMTNMLWSNEAITNIEYVQQELLIPAPAAGTYYIGFKGYSDIDMFYLYLDTITIEELTESLDPPTDLTATINNYYNVHLEWESPTGPPPPPDGFSDSFETYPDFSLEFAPWTLVDVDQSTTYGMTGTTWANAYAAQAYMVFNPTTTVPPLTDPVAHTGTKMAACFASTTPPNNDWMISPQVQIAAGDEITFWAKSYTAQYGLERFKVGVSTTGTAPANFTIISGATYIQAPVDWTQYTYSLSAYAGQNVYIGIQCLSNDAFIFLVDDVFIGGPADRPVLVANAQYPATHSREIGVPSTSVVRTPTRDLLGYKVYRDGTLLTTINNPATLVYDDNGLAVGNYSYTVTAIYDSGESQPAGPVAVAITAPPAMPTNLTASVEGNDVTLDWDNPEPPQQGDWISWATEATGNSVGTNAAVIFDVAHRWTEADLAPYAGRTITQLKFVPAHEACTYTVKVWTGGSATNAGTLVSSQVVTNPTIDEYNLVVLNTPVPIPATGELWYGFEVNTQGGYPAGCDDGPQIEGKGNMIYFQNTWSPLTALAATLTYNWAVRAFAQTGAATKAVELVPIVEHQTVSPTTGTLAVTRKESSRDNRPVTGYKVYRDGTLISTITDPGVTTYLDMDLANGTYNYSVTATHTTGESEPATVQAIVNVQLAPVLYGDDFENQIDFATTFANWTLLDVDQSATYGITGVEFPNSGAAMAYIAFNPSATTPPLTTVTTHGGAKMAACFAGTTPPNNDWMITRRMTLGTGSALKFYAKSHTAQYGLERFRVGISTLATIIPQGFQYITGTNYVEAPTAWTEYVYDLSAYDGQTVYIGIRCVSNDAFVFYVDDFTVHSNGGAVSNDDNTAPALQNALSGNYPNPFNPETTIRFSTAQSGPVSIEIYNVRGQLVKTLVNDSREAGNYSVVWNGTDENGRNIGSGVYYYKMNAGKFSSTKKMILMK